MLQPFAGKCWRARCDAKFIVLAAVALGSTCLCQSVAFAWGPRGGAPGIPGFSSLWQDPNPRAFSQETKKGWGGDPIRRAVKGRKKCGAMWGRRQVRTAVSVRTPLDIPSFIRPPKRQPRAVRNDAPRASMLSAAPGRDENFLLLPATVAQQNCRRAVNDFSARGTRGPRSPRSTQLRVWWRKG